MAPRTIQEILDWWRKEESAILQRRFSVIEDSQNLSRQEVQELTSDVIGRISDEQAFSLLVQGAQDKAGKIREEARTDYDAAYIAFMDMLQDRKAEVELALWEDARNADPQLTYSMAGAPAEKLRSAMELSFQTGDLALGSVAFAEAYRRGDDALIAYYSNVRGTSDEEWASLYLELLEAEEVTPISDPADRFDRLFGEGPGPEELGRELSARDILAGRQSPRPAI